MSTSIMSVSGFVVDGPGGEGGLVGVNVKVVVVCSDCVRDEGEGDDITGRGSGAASGRACRGGAMVVVGDVVGEALVCDDMVGDAVKSSKGSMA